MLPEDCRATVGWMQQQQQQQHQREKPTPRVSIDSTANLLLVCESRRQHSNRLDLQKVCSLTLHSIIQAAEWESSAPSLSLPFTFYNLLQCKIFTAVKWLHPKSWRQEKPIDFPFQHYHYAFPILPRCLSLPYSTCTLPVLHRHTSRHLRLQRLLAPLRGRCCSFSEPAGLLWLLVLVTVSRLA